MTIHHIFMKNNCIAKYLVSGILLYFQTSLISALIEDSWMLILASAFNLLLYVLLVEV